MPDKDYNAMTAIELKQECIKQGLDSKGKKAELIARLNGEDKVEEVVEISEEEKVEVVAKAEDESVEDMQKQIQILQEQLRQANASKESQEVAISLVESEPSEEQKGEREQFTSPVRIQELERKLKTILAGKANFSIESNPPFVHFEGGPKVKEGTTLIASDAAIIQAAKRYVGRVFTGKNATGSH